MLLGLNNFTKMYSITYYTGEPEKVPTFENSDCIHKMPAHFENGRKFDGKKLVAGL